MMKKIMLFVGLLFFFTSMAYSQLQHQEPWTRAQLMSPEYLADKIRKNQTKDLMILSIGFDDVIKGSTYIGPGMDKKNVEKMKTLLKNTPKDKEIVIYCGCCPFENCPNIRPPFQALNELGFKNAKLLDITQNIKVNWLDRNYPSK